MLIPVTDIDEQKNLMTLPVVAIDLGFSGEKRSCGFATRVNFSSEIPKNIRFDECILRTANFINMHPESVLIIEAPLSAAFNTKGNPQSRGSFESEPRVRWWSIGAGAAMALAAQYFLKGLTAKLPSNARCHLIEGFVSGADSGKDSDVAKRLIDAFCGFHSSTYQLPQGASVISVLDWIEPNVTHTSPIVLIPASI